MASPSKTQQQLKAQQKAEFNAARNVYLIIILSFVTVCTVAVVMTSKMEAERTGFRPIQTEAPMSFIDKTYVTPKVPQKAH